MGIVEQLGDGVTLLKKGDRVVMPFNVADGRCRNCDEGKTAFCTGVNPGFAGGAYGMICKQLPSLLRMANGFSGYVAMGPYRGGMIDLYIFHPGDAQLNAFQAKRNTSVSLMQTLTP